MKEVTDDLVAKLILDDDTFKNTNSEPPPQRSSVPQMPQYGQVPAGLSAVLGAGGPTMPPPGNVGQDKWYYRDPQVNEVETMYLIRAAFTIDR